MSKLYCFLVASLLGFFSSVASAAIVVTDITTKITEVETAVATVGLAVLVMFAGIKVWKWIRGAM